MIVNSRKIAAEYRLSHWAQIMRERSESGLSIKAYCESVGLHQNVYHYWQRKLREAAIMATKKQDGGETNLVETPRGWAVCESAKSESGEGAIQIEIGKSRITADATTDYELLAKICRMLVSIC